MSTTAKSSLDNLLRNNEIKESLFSVFTNSKLSQSQIHDVFSNFYFPLYDMIKDEYNRHRLSESNQSTESSIRKAFVVGLSAPQGCGKTTVTSILEKLFEYDSINCVSTSLDDFYLTYDEQQTLARSNPNNPLLQYRGNAGTHDVKLLENILHHCKAQPSLTDTPIIKIPRYDKAQHQGRGDRMKEEDWRVITKPVDILILEGWMLGFQAIYDPQRTSELNPSLQIVNNYLKSYTRVHTSIDFYLIYAIDDLRWITTWRIEAEEHLRKKLNDPRAGMTNEQVVDFVARFLPAYQQYLPDLYRCGPEKRDDRVKTIKVIVNENREPVKFIANYHEIID